MSNHDKIYNHFKNNPSKSEFGYKHVIAIANTVLEASNAGKYYAALRFLQEYCTPVDKTSSVISEFRGGNPRSYSDLKSVKSNWIFRLSDGKSGKKVTAGNIASKKSPMTSASKRSATSKEEIAANFVDYLRNKPFRYMEIKRKGSVWLPEDGPVTGWANRLNEYVWNNKRWGATSRKLEGFVKQIGILKSKIDTGKINGLDNIAAKIYEDIRKWGNPAGTERDGVFILKRLDELWNGDIKKVDSTLTKLYAFARPGDFIIYDSRVAAAIITIAEDIYRWKTDKRGHRKETVDKTFHRSYPYLGTYTGRGGTRPRGYRWKNWPKADGKVNAQKDANDLCKRIVDVLNSEEEDGRSNWSMREVEAVLFMEGY